jgi:phosphoglycolate phosphatase
VKYRLVIFDSDGTLADTLPWMSGIFNELADEHGFRRVEAAEYARLRELHGVSLLRELGLPLRKVPQVVKSMRHRIKEYRGRLTVFPGISEVLTRLTAKGIELAIVSSNSQENVERVLGVQNSKLITHFACGVSLLGKPAKLRQVARRSGIEPSQTIYIGDEIRDAEAANEVGIAFGAVSWGLNTKEILCQHNPAQVFSAVSEIGDKLC